MGQQAVKQVSVCWVLVDAVHASAAEEGLRDVVEGSLVGVDLGFAGSLETVSSIAVVADRMI
jgi:hypothetical protein